MEQFPFGDISFADNPEPRCACVLVLDVSGSMQGQPIRELNDGLVLYQDELAADTLAAKRVEVAIVTFGGEVRTAVDFVTAENFRPPALVAQGDTPMGAAITQALDVLARRKDTYRANGVAMYRPWVFLITDGGPTDEWRTAAKAVKDGVARKSFLFFAVGVDGANFEVLREISVSEPLKLKGTRFRDLFAWLSESQKSASRSNPGDDIVLKNPTAPDGWGTIGL